MKLQILSNRPTYILAMLCTAGLLACREVPEKQLSFSRDFDSVLSEDLASTGGVTWIDFDNDDDQDIFITNGYDVSSRPATPQPNKFYENLGDGNFRLLENTVFDLDSGFSSGSTWADYDNDGHVDVFISNQGNRPNFLYRNNGDGTFTPIKDSPVVTDGGYSFASSWVDVDSDGFVDLYVSNGGLSQRQPDFLYKNNGDGTFTTVEDVPFVQDSIASVGGLWTDLDNDNDPDLYLSNRGGDDHVYLNQGDWSFVEGELPLDRFLRFYGTAGALAQDFDNDGDIDVFVYRSLGGSNYLYENDGKANFTARVDKDPAFLISGDAFGANAADFNNDGFIDIITSQWGSGPHFFESQEGTGFAFKQPGDLGNFLVFNGSIANGDANNDGHLDVVIGQWPNFRGKEGEENHLYLSDGTDNNWLKIKLEGVTSNRSAVGAKALVTTKSGENERTQMREVSAHPNWRSQSGLILHFGLGKATQAAKVRIQWPSGKESELEGVAANQLLKIREE